jgi:hypothetical protein
MRAVCENPNGGLGKPIRRAAQLYAMEEIKGLCSAMRLKYVYLGLCVLGTVIPYLSFAPWLASNGLHIPLLIGEIAASPVAAFGWLDVAISAITLFVFAGTRSRSVRYAWLSIVATLLVGVSLRLPLYLFLRESSRQA